MSAPFAVYKWQFAINVVNLMHSENTLTINKYVKKTIISNKNFEKIE